MVSLRFDYDATICLDSLRYDFSVRKCHLLRMLSVESEESEFLTVWWEEIDSTRVVQKKENNTVQLKVCHRLDFFSVFFYSIRFCRTLNKGYDYWKIGYVIV